MTVDYPQVRPVVLSKKTADQLDEYLRFRHVVRNVYTFSLDIERIALLVDRMKPVYDQVKIELLRFADFLEQVGRD